MANLNETYAIRAYCNGKIYKYDCTCFTCWASLHFKTFEAIIFTDKIFNTNFMYEQTKIEEAKMDSIKIIKAKREGFRTGLLHYGPTAISNSMPEIEKLCNEKFPLPKKKVRRIIKDSLISNMWWAITNDIIKDKVSVYTNKDCSSIYPYTVNLTKERINILKDLIDNPYEEVDDEG